MRKILVVFLAALMCAGLCACSVNDSQNGTTENLTEETKEETVQAPLGKWNIGLWFANATYNFNENTTYEKGEEKGTVVFDSKTKKMTLSSPKGVEFSNFVVSNQYFYSTNCVFTKDEEYGLKFSPDENGRCNQKFEIPLTKYSKELIYETFYDKGDYNKYEHEFTLELKKDGTFIFNKILYCYLKSEGLYAQEERMEYSGTYEYSDSVLFLTPSSIKKYKNAFIADRFTEMPCDGTVCPMYVDETGIHLFTFKKGE